MVPMAPAISMRPAVERTYIAWGEEENNYAVGVATVTITSCQWSARRQPALPVVLTVVRVRAGTLAFLIFS